MSLYKKLVFCSLILALHGCSLLTSSLGRSYGENLAETLANSDDPDTVRDALPGYLLTLDALARDSTSAGTLWAAARLDGFYAGQFARSPQQKQALANKAWDYAQRAACVQDKHWCSAASLDPTELRALLITAGKSDVGSLYQYGSAWAGWLEANSSNWNAVGKLGNVRLVMQRVLELDERYDHGNAHLYLGVLDTILPAALGGKPDEGKQHFERVLALSGGNNLMAATLYAERYARLVFDRELHDRLLQDVLSHDAHVAGLTLSNVLAQQKARELQKSADAYF